MATGSWGDTKGKPFRCPRGPDHEGPCYQTEFQNIPYQDQGNTWKVIVGATFNAAFGTLTANTNNSLIEVEDAQDNVVDSITISLLNYIAAPTTGALTLPMYLLKKMLLPPKGGVESTSNLVTAINLVDCATLEDAIAII